MPRGGALGGPRVSGLKVRGGIARERESVGIVEDVIKVAIVDDDALVRTGLGLILGGSPSLRVVGEADDGDQALALVARTRPDVVLMDIRMPRVDGLRATQALLAQPQPPKVIVLTTFDSDEFVLGALEAGAAGFLLKDTPPERMVAAIHAVAAGEPILSPAVTAKVIAAATRAGGSARHKQAEAELGELADRERDVAIAIGQGKSNAEIAAEMYLSVATVKAYVTRIFTKLGVDNRVQVAMKVHDAGLV